MALLLLLLYTISLNPIFYTFEHSNILEFEKSVILSKSYSGKDLLHTIINNTLFCEAL